MLGKRKDISLFEEAGNPAEKVASCPKEPIPPCRLGARAFKGEFQGFTGGVGGPYAGQHSQL